jgi:mRNA-degrading endonuclease RelE of RelBE toxin-antitoxin system
MSWTVTASPRLAADLADLPKKVQGRVEAFVFTELPAIENPFALPEGQEAQGLGRLLQSAFRGLPGWFAD